MIWGWIAAAVIISIVLTRKGTKWYHFIWVLLPIDMYGVSLAGSVIKPYMVFGGILILYNFYRKGYLYLPKPVSILVLILAISDGIVGMETGRLVIASVMQHVMLILVFFIALSYLDVCDWKVDFKQIAEVSIATTIGFGIVFSFAYLCYKSNIHIAGVSTTDRFAVGMIQEFVSTGGKVTPRFRGFCIDPNNVITTIVMGNAFSLFGLFSNEEKKVKYLTAIVLFNLVVYFTGSRMALICSMIIIFVVFGIEYAYTEDKGSWVFYLVILSAICLGYIIFTIYSGNSIIERLLKEINDFFYGRASLNDDSGRFTIWTTNIGYLVRTNKIWFGVGQNQIYLKTSLGLACHNTWLEWICGTGLFIGLGLDYWFISAWWYFYTKCKQVDLFYREWAPLIVAYILILFCITMVDNITNSAMFFLLVLFRYSVFARKKDGNNRLKKVREYEHI